MATNSPLQGVPLPEVTDADNVPYDLGNAVTFIEGRLVMRFDSATHRDAVLNPATAGMVAYLGDQKLWTAYNGAAWAQIATTPGAWVDYSTSFTITASTNPTKGNSSYSARYQQIGKTVHFRFHVTIGSTFTPGSGVYNFSLPVPSISGLPMEGVSKVFDAGTANRIGAFEVLSGSSGQITLDNAGAALDHTGPGTAWAGGDIIRASITYEAA